jgi:isopenicillin-N epimerase
MDRPTATPWILDPTVTFLNHGSFGSCPRPVLAVQTELREQIEREPVLFLDIELERRLDDARQPLAALVGAHPADLVFLPNATTGVNTVLRSLDLRPGDEILTTDHEYNACLNAIQEVTRAAGAGAVIAQVPFPVRSADEVVDAMLAAVTPRTRLAVFSHVTSPTALVFPVERIAAALGERGIEMLVDGAHAPGMVPLAIDQLARMGVVYYTANCHKWLCAPKGAGFLWVRRDRQQAIRPLVISHAANSSRADRSRFLEQVDWTGTLDPTPYLAVPAALEFLAGLMPGGLPELTAGNRRLALAARDVLSATLATDPPAPDDMIGAMAALALPEGIDPAPPEMPAHAAPGTSYPQDPLHNVLFERYRIEVPISTWPPVVQADRPRLRLLRISAQAYNGLADYARLAQALHDLVPVHVGGT